MNLNQKSYNGLIIVIFEEAISHTHASKLLNQWILSIILNNIDNKNMNHLCYQTIYRSVWHIT